MIRFRRLPHPSEVPITQETSIFMDRPYHRHFEKNSSLEGTKCYQQCQRVRRLEDRYDKDIADNKYYGSGSGGFFCFSCGFWRPR